MINKSVFVSLLFLAALMVAPRYGCQTVSPNRSVVKPVETKILKLIAEYKKNKLEDISTDGRFLLFYQTSTPMRTYTIPLDGGGGKANQPEIYGDMLRVVDRTSGREIKHIRVGFFPEDAQFVPGTRRVFFKEPKYSDGKLEWRLKVWDLSTGEANVCSNENAVNFQYTSFLDDQRAVNAVSQEDGKEQLSTVTLPTCKRSNIDSINPSSPTDRAWGGFKISTDKHHLAYALSVNEILIRDTATLGIVKRLKPPSGLFFTYDMIYTLDGTFLLIAANNKLVPTESDTKRTLLIYNTANYQPMRRLEIEAGSAMAVSPDSRLLAVGYTKEEKKFLSITEQAQIVLYDLATGEEVARASHPAVQQKRSDPFIAMINKLAFTPDGKYLLSSTYDTRVWQIGN